MHDFSISEQKKEKLVVGYPVTMLAIEIGVREARICLQLAKLRVCVEYNSSNFTN